ncbi:MAG TPA: transglycosylase SLT domain-containing protein [Kofleriaceae bacterium]|nr:transglycosylase SLT domain-containing protein [Kofleriaceae bacterium]
MRGLVPFVLLVAACTTSGPDLEWVAPIDSDVVPVGDPIELAVASDGAATVTFVLDGQELAVCDPSQPDEDCRRDNIWRWTTVFTARGLHELTATSYDDEGNEIESVMRVLTVVQELQFDDTAADDLELEPTDGGAIPPEVDDIGSLPAVGRGFLDPDRAYHSIFGGISWRMLNQRVRLHSGVPSGSVADIRGCMNRYGSSIRHWADHFHISRGSVVATAMTESNCTNPAGSSDGLSSGPMQVTASTCSAITGLSRSTCRSRMHTQPDFSFQVGVKYMASSFQVSQHRHDPPKIAAAYNAGSLHKTFSNRWHMVSTGNHIDRFVRAYNAYRSWEANP